MSNPSGDSTIHDLPPAAPLNGSEEIPVDQVQSQTRFTVKLPATALANLIITGINVGTTAQRPAAPLKGQPYFDTTLGYPVWWRGDIWVNSAGFGPI